MNTKPATVAIFAHLGHWYVGLPVYLGPVVLLTGWLKYQHWREGRARRGAGQSTLHEELP